jgi:two-component system NarL family response regulator
LAAIEAYEKLQPDIVLMDLRMPQMDGPEATTLIRRKYPAARILVLTTFDNDEDIFRGLEAGAMGYLVKNTESGPLLETIRAVYSGTYSLPAAIAARLAQRRATPELSPRELEVLLLIVKGNSNKEIGGKLSLAENTVKNHVKMILEKLGVSDRTQAVTTALQRGLARLD